MLITANMGLKHQHRSHRCSFRMVSCIAAARRASRRLLVPGLVPAFLPDMLEAVSGTWLQRDTSGYKIRLYLMA